MLHLPSSQRKDGISERAVVVQNGELIPTGDGKLETEIDGMANTIKYSADSSFRENGDTLSTSTRLMVFMHNTVPLPMSWDTTARNGSVFHLCSLTVSDNLD